MSESGIVPKRNLAENSGYPRRRAGGAPLARERAPRWVTGIQGCVIADGSRPLDPTKLLAPGENRRPLFTFSGGRVRSHMERWAFHRHPQGDDDGRCKPTTLLHSAAQTSRSPHRAVAQHDLRANQSRDVPGAGVAGPACGRMDRERCASLALRPNRSRLERRKTDKGHGIGRMENNRVPQRDGEPEWRSADSACRSAFAIDLKWRFLCNTRLRYIVPRKALPHRAGLPGCWSQGATEAEALENIRVAIVEYLSAVDDCRLFDPKPHSSRAHECKQRRQAGIAGPAQCSIERLARQSGRCRNACDPPAGLGDGSKRVHDVAFVTTRKCFIEQGCDVRVVGEMFDQEVRVRPTACRSAWSNPPSTASHFSMSPRCPLLSPPHSRMISRFPTRPK